MSRGPDAATLLHRALLRDAAAKGCTLTIAGVHSARWSSATFIGARHRLEIDAEDDAACAAWLGTVAEAEVTMRGHFLADAHVASVDRSGGRLVAIVEALTVEA
jgi:hypothetical protein